jgi:hypothetical protein
MGAQRFISNVFYGVETMTKLMIFVAIAALAGCGAETATTAATGAAIKKQEVEQGNKTAERMRKQVDEASKQTQERTNSGDK